MPSKWQMTSVEQPSRFKRCRQLGGPCLRMVKASHVSGDSWTYPDANVPQIVQNFVPIEWEDTLTMTMSNSVEEVLFHIFSSVKDQGL